MTKVLLIYPPGEHMIRTNVPDIVDDEIGFYPPLGILYVAGYLLAHTDHEVEVLDTHVEHMDYPQLRQEIERRQPDVVGIQTLTFTLIDAMLTAGVVKEVNPDIHVTLGGPHVNIYPIETIGLPQVDSVVLGEGEIVFSDLVEALAHGIPLERVPGILFKRDGEVIHTGANPLHHDLDSLPWPARELTPTLKYQSLVAKRSPITTMMTSRGCPFRCIYCDRPHLGKQFRARSARNVVDEMQHLVEMGIHEVFIYDDTFTVDRQRVLDICDDIVARGLDIGWDFRAHINTMNREMLEKLAVAGCERIHYGVEAGTPEISKVLMKNLDLNRVRDVITMTKEVGIDTLGYFMIGAPTETREQVMRTIEFATSLPLDYAHISVLTPFPATELYYKGLQSGMYERDYWLEFAKSPTADFVPELWEEVLSRDELIELLHVAYKRFYMRPSYVIKRVLAVQSPQEFIRKAKAALRVAAL